MTKFLVLAALAASVMTASLIPAHATTCQWIGKLWVCN